MPVLTCDLNKEYEESIIMLIFIADAKAQYCTYIGLKDSTQ